MVGHISVVVWASLFQLFQVLPGIAFDAEAVALHPFFLLILVHPMLYFTLPSATCADVFCTRSTLLVVGEFTHRLEGVEISTRDAASYS